MSRAAAQTCRNSGSSLLDLKSSGSDSFPPCLRPWQQEQKPIIAFSGSLENVTDCDEEIFDSEFGEWAIGEMFSDASSLMSELIGATLLPWNSFCFPFSLTFWI